jgi:hypothetical protein
MFADALVYELLCDAGVIVADDNGAIVLSGSGEISVSSRVGGLVMIAVSPYRAFSLLNINVSDVNQAVLLEIFNQDIHEDIYF